MRKSILSAILAMTMAGPALAIPVVTLSSSTHSPTGSAAVETFDDKANGQQSFVDDIGGVKFSYSGVYVSNDNYGLGNSNPYGASYNAAGPANAVGNSYTLTIDKTDANYFGLWISSADASNQIEFFNGNTLLYTFTVGNLWVDQHGSFVNFNFGSQVYNKLVFTATSGPTGFESDNHTVAAVPEASTWAIMVLGIGGLGGSLRMKRRSRLIAATPATA